MFWTELKNSIEVIGFILTVGFFAFILLVVTISDWRRNRK